LAEGQIHKLLDITVSTKSAFFKFQYVRGVQLSNPHPHLFPWVHLWTTLSHLQKLFLGCQYISLMEQSLSQLWGPIMVRDNGSL